MYSKKSSSDDLPANLGFDYIPFSLGSVTAIAVLSFFTPILTSGPLFQLLPGRELIIFSGMYLLTKRKIADGTAIDWVIFPAGTYWIAGYIKVELVSVLGDLVPISVFGVLAIGALSVWRGQMKMKSLGLVPVLAVVWFVISALETRGRERRLAETFRLMNDPSYQISAQSSMEGRVSLGLMTAFAFTALFSSMKYKARVVQEAGESADGSTDKDYEKKAS
jgi:hypothetical protein